jgi:hypothetical protein
MNFYRIFLTALYGAILFFAFLVILSLVSCGGSPQQNDTVCIQKCIAACGATFDAKGCIESCPEQCLMNPQR